MPGGLSLTWSEAIFSDASTVLDILRLPKVRDALVFGDGSSRITADIPAKPSTCLSPSLAERSKRRRVSWEIVSALTRWPVTSLMVSATREDVKSSGRGRPGHGGPTSPREAGGRQRSRRCPAGQPSIAHGRGRRTVRTTCTVQRRVRRAADCVSRPDSTEGLAAWTKPSVFPTAAPLRAPRVAELGAISLRAERHCVVSQATQSQVAWLPNPAASPFTSSPLAKPVAVAYT